MPLGQSKCRSMFQNSGKICLWNPESGILGFGILNTAQGIPNPANDWNPEFKLD